MYRVLPSFRSLSLVARRTVLGRGRGLGPGLGGSGTRMASSYKSKVAMPAAHYDELPTPSGSWKAAYDAKQTGYNLHLIIGIAVFCSTVYFVTTSGVVFFNFVPPPHPHDELFNRSGECEVVVKKCD